MALRSPVPFHNFWGVDATSGSLPNTPGDIVTVGPLNLEAGDFAYVSDSATFWICTSPGTVNNGGDATWVQVTTGAAGIDRFAPKHLVGFFPDGDPASDFSANGFYYWADNGSGNGIVAALNSAATVQGDVWIRPGSYQLTPEDAALVVPPNTRVQGAGATTIINKSVIDSNSVLTVFSLKDGAELRDLAINQTLIDSTLYAFTGSGVVEVVTTESAPSDAHAERVSVTINDGLTFPNWVSAFYVSPTCSLESDRCEVVLTGTGTPELTDNILSGWRCNGGTLRLDACKAEGGDAAVQGVTSQVSVDQCAFDGFGTYGVIADTCDLSVTGATVIRSLLGGYGIKSDTGTLLVNARITLTNIENGAQIGISVADDSGQIFGSRIEASNGIVSSNALGRGIAIGFNSVISQPGLQISSQVVDEVAHNILST